MGVVPDGANVARVVGCSGDGIHTSLVALQLHHRQRRELNVKHDDLGAVHDDGGHVSGVLLVPPEADEWRVRLSTLDVLDGAGGVNA